ncbi:hypothetical protein ACJMK2_018817 [Sinanodonta woodiana]|uniref:Uncharacterized protein n=1 Tax=Sinanodonta woodiana TaxID=1069815 RepID=A0ABD3UI51_SINWO
MASSVVYGLVSQDSEVVISLTNEKNSTIPTITQSSTTIVNTPMEKADIRSFADNTDCRYTVNLNGTIKYIVTIGNGVQESCTGSISLQDFGVTKQTN